VIYRICITVQVVFFLATTAMVFELKFKALYIILLALFHDLQIVTIAYDKQVAGPYPETPTVKGLLMQSWAMGFVMFAQTMGLIMFGHLFMSDTFKASQSESFKAGHPDEMDEYLETAVFLQISNSSAILILSARTVGWFFSSLPAWQLMFTTALGQVVVNTWILVFAGTLIKRLEPLDVGMVWLYDIFFLLVLDIVKMMVEALWDKIKPTDLEENPAMLKDQAQKRLSRKMSQRVAPGIGHAVEAAHHEGPAGSKKIGKRLSQKIGGQKGEP